MSNGGLEVVNGSHEMQIPINEIDRCIEEDWVQRQKWIPVELEPGRTSRTNFVRTMLTIYARTIVDFRFLSRPSKRHEQ